MRGLLLSLIMMISLGLVAQENDFAAPTTPTGRSGKGGERNTVMSFGVSVWAPSFKFEQAVSDLVSIGVMAKGRFTIIEGGRVDPFVRFYPAFNAPEGAYVQIKGSYGRFRNTYLYDTWNSGSNCYYDVNGNYICDNNFYNAYGGGVTGGYQLIAGKNDHFCFDVYGGFQYIRTDEPGTTDNIFRRWIVRFPLDIGVKLGVAF